MKLDTHHRRARVLALPTLAAVALLLQAAPAAGQELVLGEESIAPGIVLIFEGAVRDQITPRRAHLAEDLTDVHVEARVNWGSNASEIPAGTPPGGFVAYLNIHAQITNKVTLKQKFATLTPHINLIDSFHYARNIALPGEKSDLYTVKFVISTAEELDLSLHRDWSNAYAGKFISDTEFVYTDVNFVDIATAPPRASSFAPANPRPE